MTANESKPSALDGIFAVWWREISVFFRETPRAVSAVASPLLWLVIFGAGISRSVVIEGMDYQQFIFGGVLVQTFLFSSLFYGAYLVWDRKIDVLKAVLVSPLSRQAIFLGKVLGGVSISIIEALIVLLFGYALGVHYSIAAFFEVMLLIILSSAGLTALGLTVGAFMESPEGFQLLSTLILFPLFFLSGALFPVTNLTGILALLASINPISYIVDLVRGVLLGTYYIDPVFDMIVLAGFIAAANIIGILAFERMKA